MSESRRFPCIPTFERPELLRNAINSCLGQTFQDFEIVISDDSRSTETAQIVQSLAVDKPMRYIRNAPGLGQARNVNQLFQMAAGELLLLLHDDNLLMPDALSSQIAPLRRNPSVIAAFGKQYVASDAGEILYSHRLLRTSVLQDR